MDKCVKMVRDIHGNVKVHETRSQAHAASAEEEKGGGKKRKGEKKGNEAEGAHKNIAEEVEEKGGGGGGGKKHKAENKAHEAEQSHKKGKAEKEEEKDDNGNGKSAAEIAKDFEEFCKATSEHLSMKQMREILEANGQGPVSDDAVVPKWYKVFLTLIINMSPISSIDALKSSLYLFFWRRQSRHDVLWGTGEVPNL